MKKKLALLATLPFLVACNRIPAGILSLSDGDEATPRVVDSNSGNRAERDLKRLSSIDNAIQASLNRLDAALDPNNKTAANLEKLVVGDGIDPALASNRQLRQQAQIDQKFDQKNQALIDNTKTGNLDNVQQTNDLDPAAMTREQKIQAAIDSSLDRKAIDAVKDSNDSSATRDSASSHDSSAESKSDSSFDSSSGAKSESSGSSLGSSKSDK